jgi:two-component system NtrC family sensor kinase
MAGETILIIEDRRENIVHLANNILKPNGYEIITAMDGRRGLKRIVSDEPDLVILDLNMPKMDGLEVLAAVQERRLDVPVILTTFYGSEHVAEKALSLGAFAYVVKPYDVEEMLATVQKALAYRPSPPPPAPPDQHLEATMPLTRQVERWARDMNILTRVGKALVAILDQDRICTRAVEAAIYVTRADYGFLYLAEDEAGNGLRLCAMRGPQDQRAYGLDTPVDSGLAVQAAQSGQVLRLPAPSGDVALFEIVGEALGPVAAAPLRWRKATKGVLMVARSRHEAAFNEADEEWLGGLADYVAIAVSNACAVRQQVQPAAAPSLDNDTIANLRQESERLSEQLQAAALSARQLAALLEAADLAASSDDLEAPTSAA